MNPQMNEKGKAGGTRQLLQNLQQFKMKEYERNYRFFLTSNF
jgi:hypothetical protein